MWWLEFAFVVFFAMGWYPCCCSVTGSDCVGCATNTAFNQYTVEISGMANATCSGCAAAWDGTHVVTALFSTALDLCEWKVDVSSVPRFPGGSCTTSTGAVYMKIKDNGIFNDTLEVYLAEVTGTPTSPASIFVKTLSVANGSTDCTFSAVDVPYSSDNGFACTGASATCTVTKV